MSGEIQQIAWEKASTERSSAVEPSLAFVAEQEALADVSRFIDAHRRLSAYSPPLQWKQPEALCSAARLARHLGSDELAAQLALRAYRLHPQHADARYWAGLHYFERRGPIATLHWLDAYSAPSDSQPSALANLCWLRASVLMALRDFDGAERCLARARELDSDRPYAEVMQTAWFAAQDRYEEARAVAAAGLTRYPTHRPSIESYADLEVLRGNWHAALEVLHAHAPRTQSGWLYVACARIELELGRYGAAQEALDEATANLPWLDGRSGKNIAAMRSDAAYHLGDIDTAKREALNAGSKFFDRLHARLQSEPPGSRVLLNVGFVRQHHLTCVPATLTMLSRFWKRDAEHLEIAERICFNGTSSHAERVWAAQNGWVTREFTVTPRSARALLDRGIPFIVDTVHAISAHAQAVIGYDDRRGTLYIRDPYIPATLETALEEFLTAYAAHGPRGFAMVPSDRAELFAEIEFDDLQLYTLTDKLEAALEEHRRKEAGEYAGQLAELAPSHRLTLLATRALAAYDSNTTELLSAVERALALYPKEPTLLLNQLSVMRGTSAPSEVVARLREIVADAEAHPVFLEMLAAEILGDSRHIVEAERMLRRVARMLRDRANTLMLLAQAAWQALAFDRALELYRLAACLEPTNERPAYAYFRAALARGQSDRALAFLQRRVDTYAKRSSAPSMTLFTALEAVERTREAFAILERATETRDKDGVLLRFAAEAYARYGETERARHYLTLSETCSARAAWLRCAATLADYSGEHELSIKYWREITDAEPLAVDAHAALAQRLAAVYGPSRALQHVEATSRRFPENAPLFEVYLGWLTNEDPSLVETELLRLLALQPNNAWAMRELALTLCKLGRLPEAKRVCSVALALAPHQVSGQLVAARVAELDGDFEAAKTAYVRAFELHVDVPSTISSLLDSATNQEDSLAILGRIEAGLVRASISGEGVGAWYEVARRHLHAEDLETRLQTLHDQRPDLWSVWACRVRYHCDVGDSARAVEIAHAATERFPLLPALWYALARALKFEKQIEASIAALERALSISPQYTQATLLLVEIFEQQGANARSLGTLERGLRVNPLDQALLLTRADVLWRTERREEALASVLSALGVDASNRDVWDKLAIFARNKPELDVLGTVQKLAQRRPWDPQIRLRLAEVEFQSDPNSALQTVERALELDPLLIEAHDLYVEVAAKLGHRALAQSACHPKQFGDRLPIALRGRQAWLKAVFGDLKGAIKSMQLLIAERPHFVWGLRYIADWAEQLGDRDSALEATDALVRLEPTNAMVHGYRGKALLDAKKPGKARKALEKALELQPGYRYAAHELLELLFDKRDLTDAQRTIERLERHWPNYDRAYFRMRLALAHERYAGIDAPARELFSDPDATPALIEKARAALSEKCRWRALRVLDDVIRDRDAPVEAGTAWARLSIEAGDIGVGNLRKLRHVREDVRAHALTAVFEHLGNLRAPLRALWLALWHWREARSNPSIWGSLSYVFANADYRFFTVFWMWGYEHKQPQAWMLMNLAVMLRKLGFADAAAKVNRDALALTPDQTQSAHVTMLALYAATAGSNLEAQTLLDEAGEQPEYPHYANLRELVAAMTALSSAPPEQRAELAREAWLRLDCVFPGRLLGCLRLRAFEWRRVARRIGRGSRSVSGLVKGYWDSVLAPLLWLGVTYGFFQLPSYRLRIFVLGCVIGVLSSRRS